MFDSGLHRMNGIRNVFAVCKDIFKIIQNRGWCHSIYCKLIWIFPTLSTICQIRTDNYRLGYWFRVGGGLGGFFLGRMVFSRFGGRS